MILSLFWQKMHFNSITIEQFSLESKLSGLLICFFLISIFNVYMTWFLYDLCDWFMLGLKSTSCVGLATYDKLKEKQLLPTVRSRSLPHVSRQKIKFKRVRAKWFYFGPANLAEGGGWGFHQQRQFPRLECSPSWNRRLWKTNLRLRNRKTLKKKRKK